MSLSVRKPRSPRNSRRRQPDLNPQCEHLEIKIAPATLTWTGEGNALWSTVGNWSIDSGNVRTPARETVSFPHRRQRCVNRRPCDRPLPGGHSNHGFRLHLLVAIGEHCKPDRAIELLSRVGDLLVFDPDHGLFHRGCLGNAPSGWRLGQALGQRRPNWGNDHQAAGGGAFQPRF